MNSKKTSTYKLILFFAAGIAALLLIAKCNESFNSYTPGNSKYYKAPQLDSQTDTTHNQTTKP